MMAVVVLMSRWWWRLETMGMARGARGSADRVDRAERNNFGLGQKTRQKMFSAVANGDGGGDGRKRWERWREMSRFHDSVGQKRKRSGNFHRRQRNYGAEDFLPPQMAAENMGSTNGRTEGSPDESLPKSLEKKELQPPETSSEATSNTLERQLFPDDLAAQKKVKKD
ncbi:hypothetical protein Tco_0375240 [Tanacetum coccineum]